MPSRYETGAFLEFLRPVFATLRRAGPLLLAGTHGLGLGVVAGHAVVLGCQRVAPLALRLVAEANARGTLTMMILHYSQRDHDTSLPYVRSVIAIANDTFRTFHDGYNLDAVYYEVGAVHHPPTSSEFYRCDFVSLPRAWPTRNGSREPWARARGATADASRWQTVRY